ncbi:hypothetical protein KCU92_g345, partial [Aureobasidium melanogenum]
MSTLKQVGSIGIKGLVPKIGQTDVRKAHELSLFVSPYVFNTIIETTLLVKFQCQLWNFKLLNQINRETLQNLTQDTLYARRGASGDYCKEWSYQTRADAQERKKAMREAAVTHFSACIGMRNESRQTSLHREVSVTRHVTGTRQVSSPYNILMHT